MATTYAKLINQYMFSYLTLFSASFYRISEEDQRSDETELFIKLKINHNLKENDNNNIDVKSQLEHQIETQETNKVVGYLIKIKQWK